MPTLFIASQQHGKEFLICSLGSQSDSSRYVDVNYILKTIDESDYLTKWFHLPDDGKRKKAVAEQTHFHAPTLFRRLWLSEPPFLFIHLNSNDDPLPCKGMAALGGSRHALINLSTQIDIPPIIKKSLSPATGYFGHKDEQSHHLNTFYVSFASVCALQMGAFCILQNFFQRNFCFRPAFEKVVCIITRKGEVLPTFRHERRWEHGT